jgi:hypothetical protein
MLCIKALFRNTIGLKAVKINGEEVKNIKVQALIWSVKKQRFITLREWGGFESWKVELEGQVDDWKTNNQKFQLFLGWWWNSNFFKSDFESMLLHFLRSHPKIDIPLINLLIFETLHLLRLNSIHSLKLFQTIERSFYRFISRLKMQFITLQIPVPAKSTENEWKFDCVAQT